MKKILKQNLSTLSEGAPTLHLPQGARGKSAFTMAEILIVIAIVGFVCMALMSVIRTAMPDYITVMKRKCYQILEDKVTQMYYDDDLYVRGTKRGFGNLQNIEHNGKTYGGNTKFCELFASMMNKWGGTTCEEDKMTFKTADNVYWYLPVTDFAKGYAVVKFDVNGSKKPNCEYDATTCPKPDTFRYYVLGNGKISEHEPKPEEFDYCIRTIISGSGSVLPNAEYCGLKNGTYELTSVPATGWSSPWADNKKEVTILDSDEVVYLNFTKDPEPTTPTTPTEPEPTSPTEPTTPTEPTEPSYSGYNYTFNIMERGCPLFDIDSINTGTSSSVYLYSQGLHSCNSKIEIYVNGKLYSSAKTNPRVDQNKPCSEIYSAAETNTDMRVVPCTGDYGRMYLVVTIWENWFSKNSSNDVTIKFIPRELFNIDKEDTTFKIEYDENAYTKFRLVGDGNGSVTYSAKKADTDGWLMVGGTYFKQVAWPAGNSTIRPKESYDCTVYTDVMEEGMQKACSAIGAHPANKEQMNKYRRATATIESREIEDFGCIAATPYSISSFFGFNRVNLLGGYGADTHNYCPAFNTETASSRYTGGSSHNPILCVK